MAKKRANQGRRVANTIRSQDYYNSPEILKQLADRDKQAVESAGKQLDLVQDLSVAYENIFDLQQRNTQEADRQYGIEKQLLNTLEVYANKIKIVALEKRKLGEYSREDQNIIKQTISDYEDYNREAAGVAKKTQELLRFRKEQVPFEDKIRGFQAEIASLQSEGVKNLSETNKLKLKDLESLNRQYQVLSKQEQMNQRIEKIQENISGLMFDQGTAAGQILSTMKDIVTNPLVIFTGLLALGVQRYEEMRQRSNQLAEEQDRVNKALAGAGPFQDKIIERARRITSEFRAAGEGFASSFENAVTSVSALEAQLGNVDFITEKLVDQMSKLKLAIGLSDEESAKVLDNFMIMSGLSEDAAISASNLTYQMSETMGLNPAVVFQDIANASAETLAHFTGGAHQISKAAVEARRMGITLQDVANISKSLLDFETSIEAEMEAQMLTGKTLNFNRARMFAMNKQGDKAAKEVLRQVGGLEQFRKMNIFQQEAIAKATGLELDTLLKSNAQRERENKLARDKDKLVGKQLNMSIEVTKMMGKLDVGLTIMQEIAKVLGDLFLDVFMPGMKQGEKTLLGFIKGDKFKTVVTTILNGIKAVMSAIVDVFKFIGNSAPFKALSNYFGGGRLSASNPGAMDGEIGAQRIGNAVKIGLGAYALFKLGTFLNPMVVTVKGMAGKGGGGLGSMFGLSGSPGQFYKGGQFMPGGGRAMAGGQFAAGRKFLGMNLGRGLGGASGSLGTALGGTALGTAGAVLGAAGAVGSIGMGIYDVATLGDRATGRDRATAYGGLGGAAGGAALGAAIGSVVPVVGTLLGAGIGGIVGYFGGRSVGAMDRFRDELDESRDMAQEASEKRAEAMSAAQHRFELDALQSSVQIGKSFKELSGGMKELTGKKMKEFGDLLIEQGLIGKKAFAEFAKDGKITMDELAKIQSSVSQDIINMGNEQINTAIKVVDETNTQFADIPLLQKEIALISKLTTGDVSERAIEALELKYKEVFVNQRGMASEFDMVRDELTVADIEKFITARTGIQNLTEDDLINLLDVYNASIDEDETPEANIQTGLIAVLNTLHSQKETELNTLLGQRDNLIVDEIDNLNNNGDGIKLDDGSISKINKEKPNTITFELDTNLMNQLLEESFVSDRYGGSGYARGGVLYGPRHSQGGIPTAFGELEGGEAVINRRSTKMFGGLLSEINQAGGGRAFDQGGVLKYEDGGELPYSLPKHYTMNPALKKAMETPYGYSLKEIGRFAGIKGISKDVVRYHNNKISSKERISGSYTDAIYRYIKDYGTGFMWNMLDYDKISAPHRKAYRIINQQGSGAYEYNDFVRAQMNLDMGYGVQDEIRKNIGLNSYTYDGFRKTDEQYANELSNILAGSGITTMQNIAMAVVGAKAFTKAIAPLLQTTKTAGRLTMKQQIPFLMRTISRQGGLANMKMLLGNAYGLNAIKNVGEGLYGYAKGILTPGTAGDLGVNPNTPNNWISALMKIQDGKYSSGAMKLLSEHYAKKYESTKDPKAAILKYFTGLSGQYVTPYLDKALTANSPVKKVNDMIMTADGQMIETHPDDNIIAKKGGITQKTGGGSSRVEELLLELIEVTKQSGDVYMDGAKVSAAVNSANYRV